MYMAMTLGQARGVGRFFGWFICVALAIALIGGLIIGELTSLGLILAILLTALIWTVATLPLVWLLVRFSKDKKRSEN
jgi:uncharacterized membrane protein YhaH (DUF805 family)